MTIQKFKQLSIQRDKLNSELAVVESQLVGNVDTIDGSYAIYREKQIVETPDWVRIKKFLPQDEWDKLLMPSPEKFGELTDIYRDNVTRFVKKEEIGNKLVCRMLQGREWSQVIPLEDSAMLDIETIGRPASEITMCGIYVPGVKQYSCLIRPTAKRIIQTLNFNKVKRIVTYNGIAFDIPIIKKLLGLDLAGSHEIYDVMLLAHSLRLMGGLKSLEKMLGFERPIESEGVDPEKMWEEFVATKNQDLLKKLVEYNKQDVLGTEFCARKLNFMVVKGT